MSGVSFLVLLLRVEYLILAIIKYSGVSWWVLFFDDFLRILLN